MAELTTVDEVTTFARNLPEFARKKALLSAISRGNKSSLQMAKYMVSDVTSNQNIAASRGNITNGLDDMQKQLAELNIRIEQLMSQK